MRLSSTSIRVGQINIIKYEFKVKWPESNLVIQFHPEKRRLSEEEESWIEFHWTRERMSPQTQYTSTHRLKYVRIQSIIASVTYQWIIIIKYGGVRQGTLVELQHFVDTTTSIHIYSVSTKKFPYIMWFGRGIDWNGLKFSHPQFRPQTERWRSDSPSLQRIVRINKRNIPYPRSVRDPSSNIISEPTLIHFQSGMGIQDSNWGDWEMEKKCPQILIHFDF